MECLRFDASSGDLMSTGDTPGVVRQLWLPSPHSTWCIGIHPGGTHGLQPIAISVAIESTATAAAHHALSGIVNATGAELIEAGMERRDWLAVTNVAFTLHLFQREHERWGASAFTREDRQAGLDEIGAFLERAEADLAAAAEDVQFAPYEPEAPARRRWWRR